MKVGDRLGRFELTRELGRGSHGVVFEATDVLLGERVAIKALQPWLAGDVTLRERFKRELVLTRRVSHPGVARLHDLHEENGILFISMQYVEGKSLSQILRLGLPSEDKVIQVLRGVCGALAAAHAEGVVHRDLKPANIMVTDQDKIIVLDFGIATATGVGQLTRPGEAMGSVPYVPPEVWEGGGATALGDQYALAVTGFVCLTRELPYNGKSPLEVLDALRQTHPTIRSRVPHVDPDLEAVILKAMSKAVEDRYPSISDFDDALRVLGERRGMVSKPPTGASSVPTPSPMTAQTSSSVPRAVLQPEPMPTTLELPAPSVPQAQDAGAVAAALEEDRFAAAFDNALAAAPAAAVPSPRLGGAAAARSASTDAAADAGEGDFKESTAVEAVEGHDMLPFATAVMDAPQGLTAPGGEPVSLASNAFVEAVADPNTTLSDSASIVEQAAAVDAVDAVADAFEAGVTGRPTGNKTEFVDRKRLNEVLNDVTVVAPMPTGPSSSGASPESSSPKKTLLLVAGGLAVVAVVLGIQLARGGDDVVPVVDAGVVEAVIDAGAAAVEPAVADAGVAVGAVVDAGADPVVDAGAADPVTDPPPAPPPGTGDLTLDDLDAPPPDPPPPDPTGAAKPRLSTASVDAIASAALKKGIRVGDVPALDAAVAAGRKAARANDKAGLEAATKSARALVDATKVDKVFVSDKLARFNSAFDKVSDQALKSKIQPVAREVLKHVSKGQWTDANKKLNDCWAMMKKGR